MRTYAKQGESSNVKERNYVTMENSKRVKTNITHAIIGN